MDEYEGISGGAGDAPDEEHHDEHGECRAEIHRLRAALTTIQQRDCLNSLLKRLVDDALSYGDSASTESKT